jgi:uncharacterized protein YggE
MATVAVCGRADADVPPDRLRAVLVAQADAVTGADALALVAERSAAVDAALDAVGDLVLLRRPAAVTLSPVWSDHREVTGQAARRAVTVEARADGPLGELLVGIEAVPGTTVTSTEWVVDADNAVHGRLRAEAVQDARARAEDYARAAELRLGALESISEPEGRPGEPGGWVQARAFAANGFDDSSPVLELPPEPVAMGAAVDARYALLV